MSKLVGQRVSTVLVLGANGRFGQAVCEAFAQGGWQVLAQTRRPLHWRNSPHAHANAHRVVNEHANTGAIVALELDLSDLLTETMPGNAARLRPELAGVAVVVNALNPLYTDWQQLAVPLAAQAQTIAQQLKATLMFPGNVYNFGADMPLRLTEATPQRAATRKGRLRIQIEAALRERSEQSANQNAKQSAKPANEQVAQTIIVRAGDFFGVGTGSWFDLVIAKHLHKNRIAYPGPLNLMHAWAYLPDLAKTFVALAQRRQEFGHFEVFHFAGHSLTGQQLIQAIGQAISKQSGSHIGKPAQTRAPALSIRKVPWRLMRVASLFSPMLRELVEMKYLWDVPHQLDDGKLQQVLGKVAYAALHTPIDAALVATIGATLNAASLDVTPHAELATKVG